MPNSTPVATPTLPETVVRQVSVRTGGGPTLWNVSTKQSKSKKWTFLSYTMEEVPKIFKKQKIWIYYIQQIIFGQILYVRNFFFYSLSVDLRYLYGRNNDTRSVTDACHVLEYIRRVVEVFRSCTTRGQIFTPLTSCLLNSVDWFTCFDYSPSRSWVWIYTDWGFDT